MTITSPIPSNDTDGSVVIVGVGMIGSRHLQALAGSAATRIVVAEPSPEAREKATQLFYGGNAKSNASTPALDFVDTVADLPDSTDLCILATQASGRLILLESLIDRMKVRHLVLEKVAFQSEQEFDRAREVCKTEGIATWVNCPRRMWPIFKDLKDLLSERGNADCILRGSGFSLGSNAIHFIDAFQFVTESVPIAVDGAGLTGPFADTKRAGNVDFSGTMIVTNDQGDRLAIHRTGDDIRPDITCTMTVTCDDLKWEYHQHLGKLRIASEATGGNWREEDISMPMQSVLTGRLYTDLQNHGRCQLTPLAESQAAHVPMLEAFLDRVEAATRSRPDRCNIT